MKDAAAETATIELRLNALAQLFNSLDPSPFHDRDIDADAEAHIVDWARELPPELPLSLVVHLPATEADKARVHGLEAAVANYFRMRAYAQGRELKELFRVGRRNLSISVPLLVACLLGSQFVRLQFGGGAMSGVVQESLVILGWVANWRPIETFLYDWWPIARRRDLYRRLAEATVVIKASRE